jgi:hypothetical protein
MTHMEIALLRKAADDESNGVQQRLTAIDQLAVVANVYATRKTLSRAGYVPVGTRPRGQIVRLLRKLLRRTGGCYLNLETGIRDRLNFIASPEAYWSGAHLTHVPRLWRIRPDGGHQSTPREEPEPQENQSPAPVSFGALDEALRRIDGESR